MAEPLDEAEDQAPSTVPMTQKFGVETPANPKDLQKLPSGQRRDIQRQVSENSLGPLKPIGQFLNVLASPDMATGYVVGIPNALTELANAAGDLIQRKPVDTSDNTWRIKDEDARKLNPLRAIKGDQDVLPNDEAAMTLGGVIPAEVISYYTGQAAINWAGRIPMIANLARRFQQGNLANKVRAAAQASPSVRRNINAAGALGEGVATTIGAAPLQDWSRDGGENLANVGDDLTFDITDFSGVPFVRTVREGEQGFRLPLRVEEGDNYFVRLGKGALVDSAFAGALTLGPRAVPGVKRMYDGDLPGGLEDLANADIEPYNASKYGPQQAPAMDGDAIPEAQAGLGQFLNNNADSLSRADRQYRQGMPGPVDPSVDPFVQGGALVRVAPDSAIGRAVADQSMIRAVKSQRDRLEQMGLIRLGEGDQWELTPQGMPESQGMLDLEGVTPDAPKAEPEAPEPIVPAADATEMDTALAQLDELSDEQLFALAEKANAPLMQMQRQRRMAEAAAQVQDLTQELEQLKAKMANGEKIAKTEIGAKRVLGRVQKKLDAAQVEADAAGASIQREALTEGMNEQLGPQLRLAMETQQEINLDGPNADYVLKPMDDMELVENADGTATWRVKGRGEEVQGGWERTDGNPYGDLANSPDEYRSYLMGQDRDFLRMISQPLIKEGIPYGSPEVAALIKAKTGRKVSSAKKADIVDALVEVAKRRDTWVFRKAQKGAEKVEQPGLGLMQQGDLDLGMNPGVVPNPSQARERAKQMILGKMVENGEVQAPFSVLPSRPEPQFNQLNLIDDLMSNQQLAMAFSQDITTFYNAAGQNPMDVLEEMRLRVGYTKLDGKADNLSKQMYLAKEKFYELSNQEQSLLLKNSGRFDALVAPYMDLDEWSSTLPVQGVDRSKQARPPAAQADEAGTRLKKPVKPKKAIQGRTDLTVPPWMQKQEPVSELVSNGTNFVERVPAVEKPKAVDKESAGALAEARKRKKASAAQVAASKAEIQKQLDSLAAERAQLAKDSEGAFC